MTLIIISVIFSLGLLAACYGASREGVGHVIAVAISGGFFCMLFAAGVGFIAVFLQCAITLVLAILCWPFHPSRKVLFGCCLLAAVAANAFSVRVGMMRVQTLENLREEYPAVSLTDRLAYESKRAAHPELKAVRMPGATISQAPQREQPPALGVDVATRLDSREQQGRRSRDYSLELLHDRTHEQFIFAQGFGITRMRGVHREFIELPDEPPIPLPEKREYNPSPKHDEGRSQIVDLAEAKPSPPQPLLLDVHDTGVNDFLDPNRFGYIENIDRVIGFKAHQFARIPLNGPPRTQWGPEPPRLGALADSTTRAREPAQARRTARLRLRESASHGRARQHQDSTAECV